MSKTQTSPTDRDPSHASRPAIATPGASNPFNDKSHLYLVDGSAYIFRAFHALPPLTRPSDGLPTGAVHGFCQMLWKLVADSKDGDGPSHFAVIFDHSALSFRNEIYDDYKSNRPPPPEELVPQFPLIREATQAFNLACIEQEGFEADDIIATYADQARARGGRVTIVSSDKDLMQLIGDGVVMLDPMKNRVLDADAVMEKFGVGPDRVIDVQALWGDTTDNVPGVPGIGQKTAAALIEEYGDLDTLLARAEEIKQKKRRENLIEFADQARISRDLVTLKTDMTLTISLDDVAVQEPEDDTLLGFLRQMEFNTLTRRIADGLGVDAGDIPTPKAKRTGARAADKGAKSNGSGEGAGSGSAPSDAAVEAATAAALTPPIDTAAYVTVTEIAELENWIAEAIRVGHVAVDTETDSLDAMQANLVGVSLATAPGKACYVPLAHGKGGEGGLDLDLDAAPKQIDMRAALDALKPMLESPAVLKIGQNLKYDCLVLKRYGITLGPLDDTMLLSYALDGGRGNHGMDDLAERHLGHRCIPFKEIAGTGKSQKTFDQIPIDKATTYAAEDADVTLRLWTMLKPRLVADRLTTVYETLERPMVSILVDMEHAGVKVDRQILSRLSGNFAQSLARLEAELEEIAGKKFNVGSPKQLGEILFDDWKLPGGKKTKTGAWQTGASVLDDLAMNEEIGEEPKRLVKTILEWRQLNKLKSTYTDALQTYIHPETKRIHTSFSLAAAATGRLASTEPNVQNIPIRTAEGREIRTAFIAEKGNKLISADYSQIELRVLAHIADIDALKQAFADDLDIHAMTASEMFGEPIEGMDPMIRRRAKAINFGIIYGISAFGLAAQLGISRSEAGDYINRYFERFPGIRQYMKDTVAFARANGYVQTIFGRRVHYPDINTKNPSLRGFYERAAINAPIQGSAADIIRRAMVRMPYALAEEKVDARMLLQVHDELIFEAPKDDVKKTITRATQVMESASEPAMSLSVPLKVEAEAADNWEAAH